MPLTSDQVRDYAQNYVGAMLLDKRVRDDVNAAGDHDAPDYHKKLATALGRHLQPKAAFSEDDAASICRYAGEHLQDFRRHLESVAPGAAESIGPYVDGFHAQTRE
ncbi:MAG TPA: hypothetical protein VIG32_08555 [Candidatus Baltobacteraceae bacterium]|jgi:hypothetical protein